MNISAFEFDESGSGGIELVDDNDSRVERTSEVIIVRRGAGERRVACFRVDPRRLLLETPYYLVVEYLDEGTGQWFVEYECLGKKECSEKGRTASSSMPIRDSGNWRKVALKVGDFNWTGSLDNADFRIVIVDHSAPAFTIRSLFIGSEPAGALVVDGDKPGARSNSGAFDGGCVMPSRYLPLEFPEVSAVEVTVIVPVFNRLAYTLDCLRAVMEFTPACYEVVVVDDGSTDGTASRLSNVPGLRVVRNDVNRGFAAACNAGAGIARGDWLIFLNNDTVPQPGWLTALVGAAERDQAAGVVGSRLIYPLTNTIQHAGISFGHSRLPQHDYEHVSADIDMVNIDREVDAVTGACLLTRRGRFRELGGFDDSFVNGFEDIDYCLKVKQLDLKVLFCARSTLLHYKSISSGRLDKKTDKSNVERFRRRWDAYIQSNLETREAESSSSMSSRVTKGRAPVTALSRVGLPRRIDPTSGRVRSKTGEVIDGMIVCRAGVHGRGHCVYGSFLEVSEPLQGRADFLLRIDNPAGRGKPVATLDVYDYAADRVLTSGILRDPGVAVPLSRCTVVFDACPGQILEFRVFWRGGCDLAVAGIEIAEN